MSSPSVKYKKGDIVRWQHRINKNENGTMEIIGWDSGSGWWRGLMLPGRVYGCFFEDEVLGYEIAPTPKKSYLFDRFLMIEKRLRDNVRYHEACVKELNGHLAAAMKEHEKGTTNEPWLASWLVKQTMKSERECKGGVDRNIEAAVEEINGLLPITKESK